MTLAQQRRLLTLALIGFYLTLLILAHQHRAWYQTHIGFIDTALNIANAILLPLTLYFTASNYLTLRHQRQRDQENITLILTASESATTHHIDIPRTFCTRQEIKGILRDHSQSEYNIPHLSSSTFITDIHKARAGDSNHIHIPIPEHELQKFRPNTHQPTAGTTWFISRHPGAIDWIKQQPDWHIDRYETHLNPEHIQAGDTVLGTLPIHIAADICARGASFYFLQLPQEAEKRGSEYSAQDMTDMGCTLKPYFIKTL